MGAMSVSDLKSKNRNFDNILDSYLNLVDGGDLTGAVSFKGNQTIGDASTDAHTFNGVVSGYRRAIIRQTTADGWNDGAVSLTVAQSGALVVFDKNEVTIVTLPAITANDLGTNYTFIETVASDLKRSITTAYNNDYFVGGVVNAFDAAGDTDVMVGFVSTGGTDVEIVFSDGNLANAGGGVGGMITLTAITTGNTGAGGGAKLVWAVEGQKVAQAITDTGAAYFA